MNRLVVKYLACVLAITTISSSAKADDELIAVLTKNQNNPFFLAIRVGADVAARTLKAKVVHYMPTKPDSIPEQMSQIEDVVVKKPHAIVLVPVDAKALVPGIEKINAANIPVVNVTDRAASGNFVGFIGADDYTLGLETGRHILKTMKGTGNVVILEGVRGTVTSSDRVRGFMDALKENPNVKLLASQPANYNRLQALQVMENLLQAHAKIDGVLSANDTMASGAVEALEAANRKAFVVGINGSQEAIDAVIAGKMLATGDYNGFWQGCIGTMNAIRAVRKQSTVKEVVLKATVINSSNAKEFSVPLDKRTCPTWEQVEAMAKK